VGETTVLAARMEQMATPGSIRLTPSTLGLVEGLVQPGENNISFTH
jgi:class 3 adenylate cyclase